MIITLQQLVALLPLIFIGLTIIAVMISISYRRNHFSSVFISIFGLSIALISLWFFKEKCVEITSLLHNDNYAKFYSTLILLSTLVVCMFSYPWLESLRENKEEFYLLVLSSTIGAIVLTNANHLLTLFLGIELVSLPLFGLVGYDLQNRFSIEASIKYTILSITTSSFFLFGIAIVYTQSENLSFAALGRIFNSGMENNLLLSLGFGLIIIGLCFKLSLAPFHLWIPEVYQGAPIPVSVFFANVNKIAILSAIIQFFTYVSWENNKRVYILLNTIAFTSILLGNLMALNQNNIKRLLGCSSISHTGYLLAALLTFQDQTPASIETIGVYLVSYLLSNFGMFGIINLISISFSRQNITAEDSLSFYRGLFRYHPVLSVMMTVIMFSLSGIPITLGFFGKFYVLFLTVQENMWWLSVAIAISSIVGFYYHLRLISNLYMEVSEKTVGDFSRCVVNIPHNWFCFVNKVIVLTSTIFLVLFGVYPEPLIDIIRWCIILN